MPLRTSQYSLNAISAQAPTSHNIAGIRSNEKELRQNCWSRAEDTVLTGAIVERFLTFGSLISRRQSESSSVAQAECWMSIGTAYREAWVSHCARLELKAPRIRTSDAVRRHFKVLKSKRLGFKKLHENWRSKRFETERRELCLKDNNRDITSLKQQLKGMEDRNLWTGKRCDTWTKLEEIVLCGCVVERFLKYGSLSSSRLKPSPVRTPNDPLDVGVGIRVWAAIKAMFDLAVGASTNENEGASRGGIQYEGYERTSPSHSRSRTMHALCRHFKVIKARQVQRPNELAAFYDEWRSMLVSNPSLSTLIRGTLYPAQVSEESGACVSTGVGSGMCNTSHTPAMQLSQSILDQQTQIANQVRRSCIPK